MTTEFYKVNSDNEKKKSSRTLILRERGPQRHQLEYSATYTEEELLEMIGKCLPNLCKRQHGRKSA